MKKITLRSTPFSYNGLNENGEAVLPSEAIAKVIAETLDSVNLDTTIIVRHEKDGDTWKYGILMARDSFDLVTCDMTEFKNMPTIVIGNSSLWETVIKFIKNIAFA
jgi:hypothetical protein